MPRPTIEELEKMIGTADESDILPDGSIEPKRFPIQMEIYGRVRLPATQIPWWLAEIAYKHYVELFGDQQSLQRLAERGGFGREELLRLLWKDKP